MELFSMGLIQNRVLAGVYLALLIGLVFLPIWGVSELLVYFGGESMIQGLGIVSSIVFYTAIVFLIVKFVLYFQQSTRTTLGVSGRALVSLGASLPLALCVTLFANEFAHVDTLLALTANTLFTFVPVVFAFTIVEASIAGKMAAKKKHESKTLSPAN